MEVLNKRLVEFPTFSIFCLECLAKFAPGKPRLHAQHMTTTCFTNKKKKHSHAILSALTLDAAESLESLESLGNECTWRHTKNKHTKKLLATAYENRTPNLPLTARPLYAYATLTHA